MADTIWMIVLCLLVIGGALFLFKGKELKRMAQEKMVDNAKEESPSLRVHSDNIVCLNGFTDTLNRTFNKDRWTVQMQTGRAEFHVQNPFGDITGLNVYCALCNEGTPVEQFNKMIRKVKAGGDIALKENVLSSLSMGSKLKQALGFRHGVSVIFQSYEFYIPESNPLYYSDEVREALGVAKVAPPVSPLEEFVKSSQSLPDDMRVYADSILSNVRKAKDVADSEEERERTERFVGHYIPLVNDMLKSYSQQSAASRNDQELKHTLHILAEGSGKLVTKLMENDEQDAYVAKTAIEQQLYEDGLYDPSMELIDKWK